MISSARRRETHGTDAARQLDRPQSLRRVRSVVVVSV